MRAAAIFLTMMAWGTGAAASAQPGSGRSIGSADIAFFEAKIRPLLAQHCYSCHSVKAKKTRGGLRLDSAAAASRGGESGAALVPGQPEKSLLIQAVRYQNESLQMPPSGRLAARDIALLEEWVRRGASFPDGQVIKAEKEPAAAAGRRFWSFLPPRPAPTPAIKNASWPERRIDQFILAALEKRDLRPAPHAERGVLIRRASFDLIGLPPSPAQVEQFVNDHAPDAYARLVDRLLASPLYGERWGRFWLDLARYCDVTEPWSESKGRPYLYRDGVVRAFNDDLRYDQFVMSQLAADLMPEAQPADRAALGFLGLSPTYWKELKLDPVVIQTVVAEEWEERIQALTSTFLGLTVACARCHDHKFDPITVRDYYALAGVLASTRIADRDLLPDTLSQQVEHARKRVTELGQKIAKLQGTKPAAEASKQIAALKTQIETLRNGTPHFDAPMAAGLIDASVYVLPDGPHRTKLEYKAGTAQNVALQVRGNPGKPGPIVPRRFLALLSSTPPKPFTQGSGRLELARALVAEGAPLAARVIVNRVWKHHFRTGLVETPSDFGSQGERPSHPELLDDLTVRFMQNNWSIKWLHREIMMSATYRQASTVANESTAADVDPDNRLLWRMNRRRLEVESWRDAMLAVTATLSLKMGGPPADLGSASNDRRTIYGTVKRRELNDLLRLHDFPDPTAHNPNRLPTTTPLQQLFVLNSPFMQQQASALARHLQAEVPHGAEARIRRAYQLLFNRAPTREQLRLGLEFLAAGAPATAIPDELWQQYAQVLLGSNEFLYVD